MQPYQRTQRQQEQRAGLTGLAVTLGVHALALVALLTSGFTYLDPPPPERSSLVIEFEEELEMEKPMPSRTGRQPQADEVDVTQPVELVQRAESPHVIPEKPNTTPATQPDPHGDVEVPTPPVEEPKLDPRNSFPGMGKKEDASTTPHSAEEPSEGFKAGQSDGNTKEGKSEGSANAQLKGRSVMGTLPKPAYGTQAAGTVVVQIKVNQYGNVTEAIPGAEGTTVTDKNLWNAARNAALQTTFNMKADAPVLQLGTITYIFKLK